MSDPNAVDRRHDPRINVECPAKVHNPLNRRYRSAHVRNLSEGGAMLRIQTTDPLVRGDRIQLYVDATDSAGVIDHGEMRSAVLVHVERSDKWLTVGLRFDASRVVAQAA